MAVEQPNSTFERTARSHALAAAAQRGRSTAMNRSSVVRVALT